MSALNIAARISKDLKRPVMSVHGGSPVRVVQVVADPLNRPVPEHMKIISSFQIGIVVVISVNVSLIAQNCMLVR